MKENLATVSSEIQDYLKSVGIAIFHGEEREVDGVPTVHWDSLRRPDYHEFVAAAMAAGAKLINMYVNEFSVDMLDALADRVALLPREQRQKVERRLRELRVYNDYVCQIELSFDLGQRVYLFELRTEWFDDLNELLHEIDDSDDDDDDAEAPLGGGYFSKN